MQTNKNLHSAVVAFFTCWLIISCTTENVNAQSRDSLLRTYNNETIHTFDRFFVKGSSKLKFGELKNEFTSPITKDLYKKAKCQRILGGIVTVTAVAALVTSAILKKNDNKGALPLTLVGIGFNIAAFRFRKHSTELIDRAIWQRNKEVLFGNNP